MTSSIPSPRQLRLIIETDDFDEAVRFYRDVLGMPEQPAFATEGDDRVSILHAGIATIELATPTHVRTIDTLERAESTAGPGLRIALEVDDTEQALACAEDSGAAQLAPHAHPVPDDQCPGAGTCRLAGHLLPGVRNPGRADPTCWLHNR